MKKILLLITFTVMTVCSYAQDCLTRENVFIENDHVILRGIESFDSRSASEIHDAIIKWISVYYNDPKKVIKSDMLSTIVFEGFIPISEFEHLAHVVFDIKDGRYRWTISDIQFYSELLAKYGGELKTGIETQLWYTDADQEERISEIIRRFSEAPCTIIKGIKQNIKDNDW